MKTRLFVMMCALGLSACSHEPLTPEQQAGQQALIMQMMQNDQQRLEATERSNAIMMQGLRQNAPTNCITSYAGNSAYTTCQ